MSEKYSPLARFDFGLAFEDAGKGYGNNVAMAALILFVGSLLITFSILTVFGMVFALPHLLVGVSLAGYYMTKGKVEFGSLFAGFRKYGRVIGAMHIVWVIFIALALIFSGPYYYHLVLAMSPEIVSGTWADRFLAASLNPEVQQWANLQYLAYPFQFYLQGRLLPLFPLQIDEDLSVGEAFAASWSLTSKVQWYLMLFMLLATVLSLVASVVGIIGLIVGIFFTLPFPMALIGAATKQLMEARQVNENV
jgi:membrane-anchored glycerophosphoryl diester phosphodiesterase (GDPDase)